MTPAQAEQEMAVDALMRWHERHPGGEQRVDGDPLAAVDIDDPDLVGIIIAAEHGLDTSVLGAFKGLAASRGLDLSQVLRAQLRGELADVVKLPAVPRR